MNLQSEELFQAYIPLDLRDYAYLNPAEERADLFRFLDCLLFLLESLRAEGAAAANALGFTELAYSKTGAGEAFAPLPQLDMDALDFQREALTDATAAIRRYIEERRARADAKDERMPFAAAVRRASLSPYEELSVLCAFAARHAAKYEQYFVGEGAERIPRGAVRRSTVDALYRFLGEAPDRRREEKEESPVYPLFWAECGVQLRLNDAADALLAGRCYDAPWVSLSSLPEAGMLCTSFYEREAARLSAVYETCGGAFAALVIAGEAGSGRRTLAKRAVSETRKEMVEISFGALCAAAEQPGADEEALFACIREGLFLAKIRGAGLVVSEVTEKSLCHPLFQRLRRVLPAYGEPVFFTTEEEAAAFDAVPAFKLCLPTPSDSEKAALWEFYLKQLPLSPEERGALAKDYANRHFMTAKRIRKTVEDTRFYRAAQDAQGKAPERSVRDALSESCYRARSHSLGSIAELISSTFRMEDLVVDPETERQLRYIMKRMRYRALVGEQWGFFEKTPYGRGVSALFYGPPGTGKTMAAQALGSELGLDVFRIDISQMVSKYIGETEKNISELFSRAAKMNAILFFDEADALFAKRSEVQDANDRNANAETAHLLQKMEEYQGTVLLATNLKDNIDDAFQRRMKYAVAFKLPGAEERLRLWEKAFPKAAPKEALSLAFFAEHFALSGSAIKEIAMSAAFIAAEDGRITDAHVREALELYYEKTGKRLTEEDFRFLYR